MDRDGDAYKRLVRDSHIYIRISGDGVLARTSFVVLFRAGNFEELSDRIIEGQREEILHQGMPYTGPFRRNSEFEHEGEEALSGKEEYDFNRVYEPKYRELRDLSPMNSGAYVWKRTDESSSAA